jgi:hypothetical protein
MFRTLALALILMGTPVAAHAQAARDRAGDTYELLLRVESENSSSDGSGGSSSSGFALVERVVAVQDDGLELEFDLPANTSDEDRARSWEWPVRVHRAPDGTMRILNQGELEARIEHWLARWEMPREACGTWIFTWTAFKIECDPLSVLNALKPFDMRVHASPDPQFFERGAATPTPLRLQEQRGTNVTYLGEVALDPEKFRRERAESDVIVGQITGDMITFDAAYATRALEDVDGLIRTTLTTDGSDRIVHRVTTTTVTVTDAEGASERSTSTETVQRTPAPPGS